MGSYTAHIIIGRTDTFHGGILPEYSLLLWENSVPRLKLAKWGLDNEKAERAVWAPTVEHMLDDAMLIISLFAIRDDSLRKYARQVIAPHVDIAHLEMYRDTSEDVRQSLYTMCRQTSLNAQLAFTVLEGSTLHGQIEMLRTYSVNAEVFLPNPKWHICRNPEHRTHPEGPSNLVQGPQPDPTRRGFTILDGGRHPVD